MLPVPLSIYRDENCTHIYLSKLELSVFVFVIICQHNLIMFSEYTGEPTFQIYEIPLKPLIRIAINIQQVEENAMAHDKR